MAWRALLREEGEDVVTSPQGQIIRVHVHTTDPGTVLKTAIQWGMLSRVKVQALQEGHKEVLITLADRERMEAQEHPAEESKERIPFGFISVCAGAGLSGIFSDLGVTRVIEGG